MGREGEKKNETKGREESIEGNFSEICDAQRGEIVDRASKASDRIGPIKQGLKWCFRESLIEIARF